MEVRKVYSVSFSPNGHTKRVTDWTAKQVASRLIIPIDYVDLTSYGARRETYVYSEDEIVVIGLPVYAGRIPNKLLGFCTENLKGTKTKVMTVSTYGNRSYDHQVAEMKGVVEGAGFTWIGGAAVITPHAFSKSLGRNRPDEADFLELESWVDQVLAKLKTDDLKVKSKVPGDYPPPYYYQPLKVDGTPAEFLKSKPVINKELCSLCTTCIPKCPMNAIRMTLEGGLEVTGTCIKCHGCINSCSLNALSFQDDDFISHKKMIEINFQDRKKLECYL